MKLPKATKQNLPGSSKSPFTKGFSPSKPVKQEVKQGAPPSHMFHIAETRGQAYELVWLNHARNAADDGYMPYTINLARGNGSFHDRHGHLHEDSTLVDMNIIGVYIRRGPNGENMRNATASNGTHWNRRLLVKFNTPEQMEAGRTDSDMENDLFKVAKLTVRLNKTIDVNARVQNTYKFAPPVHEKNPNDDQPVSMDHYLLDADVVALLEANCDILSPTFAQDYPLVASVYFDPFRTSYPQQIHQYGFPATNIHADNRNQAVGNEVDDIESFRAP